MFERARQKVSRNVMRMLDGMARGIQDWAADRLHDSTGDVARQRKGLLERHGIDLEARPEELDRQFSKRSKGYLIRRYQGLSAAQEGDGLHTEQVTTSGVDFSNDLPKKEDENTTFQPVDVRGRATSRGHGLFHQMWLTSSAYQRSWGTPLQGLVTGNFKVEPPELHDPTPKQVEEGERRAEVLGQALLKNLEGGWQKFVQEWMYALVAGFSPFETVFHGRGTKAGLIRRLAFIYPSSVDGWLLNEAHQDLEAIRFQRAENGEEYVLESRHLQLYSHLQIGNNFEGLSTLRSLTRWIQTVQLMQQLENLSKERLGVPWITAGYEDASQFPGSDKSDDKLMSILTDARAEESPVIRLPNGATLQLHSAAGHEPDWETPKRMALEQIHQRLNAEGALIAVGDTGAYAAREEASKDALQISGFMAELLCANVNGADNMPHTGVMKTQEDAHFGGPIQPGRYCQLAWGPGEIRDPKRAERINSGLQSGALSPGPSVEGAYRREVDLPLTKRQERALQEGPDAVSNPKEGGSDDVVQMAASEPMPARCKKKQIGRVRGEAEQVFQRARKVTASEKGDAEPWFERVDAQEVTAAGGMVIRAAEQQNLPGIDPEKAAGKQDRLEGRLAKKLRKRAVEFRDDWREEVRPLIMDVREGRAAFRARDPDSQVSFVRRVNRKSSELEDRYYADFFDDVHEVLQEAAETGAKDLVRSTGRTIGQSQSLDLPTTVMELRLEARDIAREALNRQAGRLSERAVELARGDEAVSLPVLEESTFGQVANRTVSGAYNAGRDAIVKEAKEQAARRGVEPDIIAERTSVLDEDTCDPCAGLDGERALVGSKKYENIRPPNKCKGKGRCRCIFSYILPSERGFDAAVDKLKRAA